MVFKWRNPGVLNRVRTGLGAGIATLVATATIAGLLLAAGVIKTDSSQGPVIVIVVIAMSFVVAYVRGRQRALPSSVSDELSSESKYSCRPCSGDHLREASRIVQPIFGRDNIDHTILEQWRLKNPKGFMEITNENNVLSGCFVVIGLEASFMEEFKRGTVSESSITGERVLSMSEAKRLKDIYISGVMVRDPGSYLGSKRTRVLIWSVLKYLKHHFGTTSNKVLYAVALNKESEKLLNTLNFSLYSQASNRVDGHNLYCIDCTEHNWDYISSRIGDLSPMCSISY